MSARYIGEAETSDGQRVHRFEVYLDAASIEAAATEARARINAGVSPPGTLTLASSAHTVAADLISAAVAVGLGS